MKRYLVQHNQGDYIIADKSEAYIHARHTFEPNEATSFHSPEEYQDFVARRAARCRPYLQNGQVMIQGSMQGYTLVVHPADLN